jgi:hypothetical protein
MTSRRSGRVTPLLVLLSMLAAPAVQAAPEGSNKGLASELFEKGVARMNAGKCDEQVISDEAACKDARDLFRRAYDLYPQGIGALRNLAYVERGLRLYASAARSFRELIMRAANDGNPKHEAWVDFAKKELEAVQPLVAHLLVKLPAERPAGLKVTLDGAVMPDAALGVSIDADPGAHALRAEAPGHMSFGADFQLATKESKTIEVVLPASATAPGDSSTPTSTSTSKTPDLKREPSSRVQPLVIAGIGLVGVGVGLGFGWAAIAKRHDACDADGLCDKQGLDQGRSLARTSNIVTGVGAVALVSGLVWYWLSAPSSSSPTSSATSAPRPSPFVVAGGAGVALTGGF